MKLWLRGISVLKHNSKGFTLAELLISLAIGGMVLAGAGTTFHQLLLTGERNENYVIAVRQVQNAGYFISGDGVMAQEITLGAPSGFPMTLSWSEWGSGETATVTYSLSDGNLCRNGAVIARHIISANAEYPSEGEKVLTLTVEAKVGTMMEERTYKVKPRAAT